MARIDWKVDGVSNNHLQLNESRLFLSLKNTLGEVPNVACLFFGSVSPNLVPKMVHNLAPDAVLTEETDNKNVFADDQSTPLHHCRRTCLRHADFPPERSKRTPREVRKQFQCVAIFENVSKDSLHLNSLSSFFSRPLKSHVNADYLFPGTQLTRSVDKVST